MTYYGRGAAKKTMVKIQTIENKLDNAESSIFVVFTQGIKISKINAKLKEAIDLPVLLGKLQQRGLVKIVFDPAVDEEAFVQLTEKGRQELTELLFSNDSNGPNKEPQL